MIPVKNDVPESFLVENAGLCLLAPWFVRLFNLLGYLDEELKSFKNTDLKIRAVFLLQYVVYGEEREYRETELGFNRLLVGLPWHVSLPKYLPLTDEEKQTVESMVEGVKANWPQLSGTSVKGSVRASSPVAAHWNSRRNVGGCRWRKKRTTSCLNSYRGASGRYACHG